MTIFEEYKQKVSKRGTGFLEFYLWIFCPLLAAYHIYNIISMANGKNDFTTWGFIYSLAVSLLALAVTATAIFLDKTTFWIDISLPIIFIISHIANIVAEIGVLTGLVSETNSFWNIGVGLAGGVLIFADVVVLIIFAAFLFYFIDHKDIYGY